MIWISGDQSCSLLGPSTLVSPSSDSSAGATFKDSLMAAAVKVENITHLIPHPQRHASCLSWPQWSDALEAKGTHFKMLTQNKLAGQYRHMMES